MQNRNKMVVLIVIREVDSVNSVGPDSAVKGLSLSGLIFLCTLCLISGHKHILHNYN